MCRRAIAEMETDADLATEAEADAMETGTADVAAKPDAMVTDPDPGTGAVESENANGRPEPDAMETENVHVAAQGFGEAGLAAPAG